MAGLSSEETDTLYDLAGENRRQISPDINQYLNDNAYIFTALRTVKKLNADENDWNSMLEELKRRKGV